MNRVMRWPGLLCGVLTAVGCGGGEPASPSQAQEPLAVQAEALTTKTAAPSWRMSAPMELHRRSQQAALLDSGLVLVMTGVPQYSYSYPTDSALLYNPYSDTWQSTGTMYYGVTHSASVKLASGKVMIVGGYNYLYMVSGAQVYDPATGGWSSGGSLSLRRQNHNATLLQSGKVLVTGGIVELPRTGPDPRYEDPSFAEVYDPATNAWSRTGDVGHGTGGSIPVLLYSGEVMLLTGSRVDFSDPATNTWRQGPSMPGSGSSATRLYSGEVLVVSGDRSTYLYDPYNGQWRSGPPTRSSRGQHAATLLYSGEVLLASGGDTERYNPYTQTWTLLPGIPGSFQGATSLLLHTGQVLVTGGESSNYSAAILTP